jgi:hypothetical protein
MHLRYEDISQDGRLLLEVMPNAVGAAVWGAQLSRDAFAQRCMREGIVPILSRFVLEGTDGPFGVMAPMEATGRFALVETDSGRIALNMWSEVTGPIGRTYPPQPNDAGTVRPACRVFAEHVFTRLFAAHDKRRVRREDLPEGAPATLPRYTPRPFASLLEGVTFTADDAPIVFGLVHTDSNQHVNSLVYMRLFEEAVLRHMPEGSRQLARRMEIAYRKPCFAGDRMRIHVSVRDGLATVAIAPAHEPATMAHAAARIIMA